MEHIADLDCEQIILEVQKYPWLYNIHDINYKNRDKKREAWLKVTMACIGDDSIDKEDVDRIGKEIQKRWKSMKDCFSKNLKVQEGKSGDPSKTKKNYVYAKQMSFLTSAMEQRQTSGNMNVVNNEENTCDVQETACTSAETTPTTTRLSKTRKMDTFETQIINVLRENSERSTPKSTDPDEMFLLSQIPLIKKLKAEEKFEFQIKFMQLLHSFTSPSFPSPTTPMPTTSSYTYNSYQQPSMPSTLSYTHYSQQQRTYNSSSISSSPSPITPMPSTSSYNHNSHQQPTTYHPSSLSSSPSPITPMPSTSSYNHNSHQQHNFEKNNSSDNSHYYTL